MDIPKLSILVAVPNTLFMVLFKMDFAKQWNIDKVLKSLYFLLSDLPARRSIYSEVGNTIKFPLREWLFQKCFSRHQE